ncbi:MAG TPA: SPW repeat protein [Terriglobia bacterium]|nr:SPW repeat protein [Terriglobia bacterium]
MPIPQLLNDIISVLLALSLPAALLSLVLAGISLRKEGGAIGGGFTKWVFWSVVFLTLQPLLSWFPSLGVAAPLPSGGISTPWLASFSTDVHTFMNSFVMGKLVTVLAAYMVLRAIIDAAQGQNPLLSILAAMFLLGAQGVIALFQGWNTGTPYATVDVLAAAWTYLAATIMPIAAGLAIIWGIFNFATHKPWLRMVGVALAMLCVSGIWKLVLAMMT